ncbi:hypothetical protein ABH922_004848 [Rhodococcus sp. 27YEA15]|uniref:DUF4328 domain-containing protein n=1 Tax=Rhodococcus sp. 27YEA15 TaxID=3156259 RepID=UPI003C7E6013
MSVVQVCARCAARWPVIGGGSRGSGAAQWCPRCGGVLLVPTRTDVHQSPARRGFRWIARPPGDLRGLGDPPIERARATPRYDVIPRWGLVDVDTSSRADSSRADRMADRVGLFLTVATVLYGLAVIAELGRYAILVYNRTRLVPPSLLTASDASVYFTQFGGLLAAVCAAVAAVCWLLRARRVHFAEQRLSDPRSQAEIIVGCAVPVINLFMPAVCLLELVRRDPRGTALVKIWWGLWSLSGVLLVVNSYWRSRDGLQAMADGVLLSAFMALIAAATAAVTLTVIHRIEHRTWRGAPESATRWIPVPRSVLQEKETVAP